MGRFRPQGVFAALITPLDRRGRVDEEGLRALVSYVVEKGVSGLAPSGAREELACLDERERARALEVVMDEVGSGVQVIASSGPCGPEVAVRLARHAEDVGASAFMASVPAAGSGRTIYQFYRQLSRATDLPLVLHHDPSQVGAFLSRELVGFLAETAGVRALEEGSGYLPYVIELLELLGDRLAILCGHEEAVLPALASGASGALLSSASVIPDIWVQLFRAVRRGDLGRARRLQIGVLGLVRIFMARGGQAAIRAALEAIGLLARRAYPSLDRRTREEIVDGLRKVEQLREQEKLI